MRRVYVLDRQHRLCLGKVSVVSCHSEELFSFDRIRHSQSLPRRQLLQNLKQRRSLSAAALLAALLQPGSTVGTASLSADLLAGETVHQVWDL